MGSLLFGFIGTAIASLGLLSLSGPTSWSYVLLSALPNGIWYLFFNVIPILGLFSGAVGLFWDHKKVFSILGLVLNVAFIILSYIFVSEMLS
jgi:hypothetical protein